MNAASVPLGFVDICTRECVAGWAANPPTGPDEAARLYVLQDGVKIDEIVADRFRADLHGGPRNGECGFEWKWKLPPPHDGCRIDIVHSLTGAALSGSPGWIDPLPSCLRGQVDTVDRQHIAGWVWDSTEPERTVWLTLLIDGRHAARFAANGFRRDLRDAGMSTGRHGFDHVFNPFLDPQQDHTLELMHGSERFGEILHLPARRTLDEASRSYISGLLEALPDTSAQNDALSFLVREADNLRHRSGADMTDSRQRELALRAGRQFGGLAPPPPCVLFVDDRAPDPTRDAGSNALLSHMIAVRDLGYRCSFVASRLCPTEQDRAFFAAQGITCLMPPVFNTPEDALRLMGTGLEVVYLHRLNNAECYTALTRVFAPTATLVWGVADLASMRLHRQAAVESRPEIARVAKRVEVREHMCAWLADATVTHSAVEQEQLRKSVPTAGVHVVPWAVSAHHPPIRANRRKPTIAFVAHYAHAPNTDAAKWLVLQIMPHLRKLKPGIVCRLIGSAMPHEVHALAADDVAVVGHAPDLATALKGVSVCVAPLRFGAGIKGKVLESWAYGLPIAMTPIAAEGIIEAGTELWTQSVATSAEGVARHVLTLLNAASARANVTAGRRLLATRFSTQTVRRDLATFLPEVQILGPEEDIAIA